MLHEAVSHQQIFLFDVAAVPVVFSRLSLINLIQDSQKKKKVLVCTRFLVTEACSIAYGHPLFNLFVFLCLIISLLH